MELTIKDYGQSVNPDENAARLDLEGRYGKVWNTEELRAEYDVIGFCAPFVVAIRKSDGARGSLEFTHSPRFYFAFTVDNPKQGRLGSR